MEFYGLFLELVWSQNLCATQMTDRIFLKIIKYSGQPKRSKSIKNWNKKKLQISIKRMIALQF